jgi:hypothetical protein
MFVQTAKLSMLPSKCLQLLSRLEVPQRFVERYAFMMLPARSVTIAIAYPVKHEWASNEDKTEGYPKIPCYLVGGDLDNDQEEEKDAE